MPRRIQRRDFLTTAAGAAAAGVTAMAKPEPAHAELNLPSSPAPPVFNLDELRQTVRAVVTSKRIGSPVFVRLTVQGTDKDEAIIAKLAQLSDLARSWIEQAPARLYACGSTASGQVCVTLQFPSGATALVSYARGQALGVGVDLMVLGNHGAIHHDAGLGMLWNATPGFKDAKPDTDLIAAIEQSLRTGKPAKV